MPPPPSLGFTSQAQPRRVSSWGALGSISAGIISRLGPWCRDGVLLGSLWPPSIQGSSFLSQLQSLEQEKGRWRVEKAQLEQSVEENKERMEKLEGYWGEAQSLCQAVDEHLRETQAQYQALERKYSKAKRLIKDYQQKCVARLVAGGPGPRED